MDEKALSWFVDNEISRELLAVRGVGAMTRVDGRRQAERRHQQLEGGGVRLGRAIGPTRGAERQNDPATRNTQAVKKGSLNMDVSNKTNRSIYAYPAERDTHAADHQRARAKCSHASAVMMFSAA